VPGGIVIFVDPPKQYTKPLFTADPGAATAWGMEASLVHLFLVRLNASFTATAVSAVPAAPPAG
jgi:hypothetical protein